MIVIGTRAMQVLGCLPAWREGIADDLDLVGTAAEWPAVEAALGEVSQVWFSPVTFGVRHIWSRALGKVEFDASLLPSRQALLALPDNVGGEWQGVSVRIISPAAQYALKAAICDVSDKHVLDYQHFRGMAEAGQVTLLPAHRDLFDMANLEASARLGRYLQRPPF